jgi:hypothetical protein
VGGRRHAEPAGRGAVGGPFLELADESLRRYASFAHALREESGIDVEYRTSGKLHVALGGAGEDEVVRAVAAGPLAARFEARLLDGAAARASSRLSPRP